MADKTHTHFHILAAIISTIAATIFLVQAVKPQTSISSTRQLHDAKHRVPSKDRLQPESNAGVSLDKVNAKLPTPVTNRPQSPKAEGPNSDPRSGFTKT
jgi:hypothetical protein